MHIETVRHNPSYTLLCISLENRESTPICYYRFEMEMLKLEMDEEPVLEFACWPPRDSNSGSVTKPAVQDLEIHAHNHGWGPAEEFECMITHPALNQFVNSEQRRFRGMVPSGGSTTWLLPTSAIDLQAFARVHEHQSARAKHQIQESLCCFEYVNTRSLLNSQPCENFQQQKLAEQAAEEERNWRDSFYHRAGYCFNGSPPVANKESTPKGRGIEEWPL